MNKKQTGTSGEIIRVQHDRAHPYVVSSRALPEDERLSWEARGLLWYLLAKPDNWQVMFNDLLHAGNAGRDKLRGMLRELETIGYLGRVRSHDTQGHWQWVSTIYENPADREPSPENPSMAQPSMVAPSTAKAAIQEVRIVASTKLTKNGSDPPTLNQTQTVETNRPRNLLNERAALKAALRAQGRDVAAGLAAWDAAGQPPYNDWLQERT
jgi:hypothetical protein